MRTDIHPMHESCTTLCYEKVEKCNTHCRIGGIGEAVSSQKDYVCSKKCYDEMRKCLSACS